MSDSSKRTSRPDSDRAAGGSDADRVAILERRFRLLVTALAGISLQGCEASARSCLAPPATAPPAAAAKATADDDEALADEGSAADAGPGVVAVPYDDEDQEEESVGYRSEEYDPSGEGDGMPYPEPPDPSHESGLHPPRLIPRVCLYVGPE